MWDYDKLFAVGNIIGIKNEITKELGVYQITNEKELPVNAQCSQYGKRWDDFKNSLLARSAIFIQYIIRLDEHGNVSEKIFDRERDLDSKKMPELKDGIFIRIAEKDNLSDDTLAYVDLNKDRLIFQDGGHESVSGISKWNFLKVVEVYDEDCINFDTCRFHKPIWRDFEYENYLEKVNK